MSSPVVAAIRASGKTIYDPIVIGGELWFTAEHLEEVLQAGLSGFDVSGQAIRTRSKNVKRKVAEILGYPVPSSFKKCQPRFPGQDFDTYVQAADNLQIWNEELSASRRYVLIRVDPSGKITKVKVINGGELAKLDTTGTITKKYQAKVTGLDNPTELISKTDTANLQPLLAAAYSYPLDASPTSTAVPGEILPISEVFERLSTIVGKTFPDMGSIQERNRGAGLHNLICSALGYTSYGDTGQFPDVPHQLLEVKLQTSPTIDLGLVLPSSEAPLGIPMLNGIQVRHCDVRYAVCCGETNGKAVTINHVILTTGAGFFTRFTQFQGKVINGKLQLPLPADFFTR